MSSSTNADQPTTEAPIDKPTTEASNETSKEPMVEPAEMASNKDTCEPNKEHEKSADNKKDEKEDEKEGSGKEHEGEEELPKRPRSAYNFFVAAETPNVKKENPALSHHGMQFIFEIRKIVVASY